MNGILAAESHKIPEVRHMLKKLQCKCCIFRRELCVFAVLMLSLLCALPASLHEWNSVWYAMDYSLGFDSRLFIGSLLRLFYPDFLPAQTAYTFVLFSLIFFLLILSFVLGYALRQTEKSPAQTGLLILIVLYLLSPGSPAYLWTTENMGRFDVYLILVTLLAAISCFKLASSAARLIVLTALGLIALGIHQAFMLVFFPLMFAMFADTVFGRKNSKALILSGFGCCLLLGIVFIYFQLFSKLPIVSLEELTSLLSKRTDLPINEVALRYEYFTSTAESSGALVRNGLSERIRYGAITLFLLAPLGGVYLYLWKSIIKEAAGSSLKYWLILLSNAAFLPAFAMTIDWGRWFGAFLTVQALQIVFLAAKKDAAVLAGLSKLTSSFRRHPFLFIIIGLWLASLGKFEATLLPDAPVFFSSLYRLLRG